MSRITETKSIVKTGNIVDITMLDDVRYRVDLNVEPTVITDVQGTEQTLNKNTNVYKDIMSSIDIMRMFK